VLITSGDHFGVKKYIRVGYGYDIDRTLKGWRGSTFTLKQLAEKSSRITRGRVRCYSVEVQRKIFTLTARAFLLSSLERAFQHK